MDYVGNIIRPPSEAYSMIVQVTVGCSHNRCTFCGTYKGQEFYCKDIKQIKRDIEEASAYGYQRVFLTDGDVLILPTETLLEIMAYINEKNPNTERISVYGNTKSILKKSLSELRELKDAGLGIIFQGIESGNREVLRITKKGAFPHKQREAALRVKSAGILLSQTVLLGIGGTELSIPHAIDTGKHLGDMSPDYASALTVMVLPNTSLYRDYIEGRFQIPDKFGLLNELKLIIENMDVKNHCFFTSNHASNYLPIRAHLPEDKGRVLSLLEKIIDTGDESILKPDYLRAL